MANQYNQYPRSCYSSSLFTLSCLIALIIFIQGPIIVIAQPNQYGSVIGSENNNIRTSSISSTVSNNDEASYDAGGDIYDDADEAEDISSSSSSTTSFSQSKLAPNITSHLPAQAEEAQKHDYEDESDSYQSDMNDDETTNQDESQLFGDTMSVNRPDMKPGSTCSNNKKKIQIYPQHLEYLFYHQIFGVIFFLNLEF